MEKKYPIAGDAWKNYIKQVEKLNEFWNNLPEVTALWLAQQIDIFAKAYPATPTGAAWVKASERLPEKCGKENSVVVRGMWEGKWPFVTYGFRNYNEENPQMYYELGSKSDCNNNVEWLDESGQSQQPGREEKP